MHSRIHNNSTIRLVYTPNRTTYATTLHVESSELLSNKSTATKNGMKLKPPEMKWREDERSEKKTQRKTIV